MNAPLQRPWACLAACLLLMAAAVAGLPHLGMTTDYKVFFGPDNPDLQAHEAFLRVQPRGLLEVVDNWPMLCLDIAWSYFR